MIKPRHWPWVEFLSSGGQESWRLSGLSNNLSSWGLVSDLNLGPLVPEARTVTCRPKQPFNGKLEQLLQHFWGSTRCFRRLRFHFFIIIIENYISHVCIIHVGYSIIFHKEYDSCSKISKMLMLLTTGLSIKDINK